MKFYNSNKCEGCGLPKQNKDINKLGYTSKLENKFCQNCFRSKNYGEFSNDFSSFKNEKKYLNEISGSVLMVIDVLNPYETIIPNINFFINKKNLTILVNKIDILPKSISHEKIINWIIDILYLKKIEFSQISLISTIKKNNIDAVANFILKNENEISVIGYSNVGKSSFIKALFNSLNEDVDNLITNSIGTTKNTLELNFQNKKIKDYPGFYLKGNYQNIMTINQLKETNPNKEIKVKSFQLSSFQSIFIGDYARFNIKNSDFKSGYQFTFSNLILLKRKKYVKNNDKNFIIHNIKHKNKIRYDLIISGLGIIHFKSEQQELEIELPKGVNFNLIKSLYQ
ncbi:MAG: ribosome biogenesis GTPase YqeH [Candidatus Tyloplasma litorale]|nr:MAG: ribosome biogenesis GTPase YqeH [Mycoplasmatales bacterium]